MGFSICGEVEFHGTQFYIARIDIFFCSCGLDTDPITFIYEMTRIAWRHTGCVNMKFLSEVFKSYRLTESTEMINHAASRVVNNNHIQYNK